MHPLDEFGKENKNDIVITDVFMFLSLAFVQVTLYVLKAVNVVPHLPQSLSRTSVSLLCKWSLLVHTF